MLPGWRRPRTLPGPGLAVIPGDPDGNVVPTGRFIYARHRKRYMTFSGADPVTSFVLLDATEPECAALAEGATAGRATPLYGQRPGRRDSHRAPRVLMLSW